VPKDARATRELLLDTAEQLMADHGPEAVSMREISTRAEQRNNNAAQYHFGSRDGIIEAVLDRRMTPIDECRAEMVATLDADAPMSALVRTVVEPLAEASRRNPQYVRFFAQLRLSAAHSHHVMHGQTRTSSFSDVRDQIDARLADLSADERSRRRWLCSTLIVHSIAEFVAAPDAQPYDAWDDLVDDLVAACVRTLEGAI